MHSPHLFCTGSVVVTRLWLSLLAGLWLRPSPGPWQPDVFEKMSMATRVSERTGDLLLPFLAGVSSCFYAAIV